MSGWADTFMNGIPFMLVLAASVLVLYGLNWALLRRHPALNTEERLPRQLVMLGATVAAILLIALSLPVSEGTRNQVIALIGVLASALLAFSSTTLITNLVAGIMLRMNRPFKTGDFIRVGDYFGRVSARGLLDTEIQSEQRELIAIPNSVLVQQPVIVISGTGALISASVSLGYEIHHTRVTQQLTLAATQTGLTDPFVQVIELGNFSVSYRVSGLLADVKSLITTKSDLHRSVLDALHNDGIEIVSPAFMNQRQFQNPAALIPESVIIQEPKPATTPEEMLFDKADRAEKVESALESAQQAVIAIELALKEAKGDDRTAIESDLQRKQAALAALIASADSEIKS